MERKVERDGGRERERGGEGGRGRGRERLRLRLTVNFLDSYRHNDRSN